MNTEMTYRTTFATGASPIGMMLALFDTIVGNLQRAANAIRQDDIESRCKELNRAALVIGQMENWLDMDKGGESARYLAAFYATIRVKMLEAAAVKSPEMLEEQIACILQVRSAWQKLDEQAPDSMSSQSPAYVSGNHANEYESESSLSFSFSA